jgi:hypothetical protein
MYVLLRRVQFAGVSNAAIMQIFDFVEHKHVDLNLYARARGTYFAWAAVAFASAVVCARDRTVLARCAERPYVRVRRVRVWLRRCSLFRRLMCHSRAECRRRPRTETEDITVTALRNRSNLEARRRVFPCSRLPHRLHLRAVLFLIAFAAAAHCRAHQPLRDAGRAAG